MNQETRGIHRIGIANAHFIFEYFFIIKVPSNYRHRTQIASFSDGGFMKTTYMNDIITDENFSNVRDRLISGKEYAVKIFLLRHDMSADDCIEFMNSQTDTKFVGAQGLSFIIDTYRDLLPMGVCAMCPDTREHLYVDDEHDALIPCFFRKASGELDFGIRVFDRRFDRRYALVVFGEL